MTIDSKALAEQLKGAIAGDVRFDAQAKAVYSTDASNYRRVPIGVVLPRTVEDVDAAVAVCREHGAAITGRGGGTSLAGQCCNATVIIDFSKYLNHVVEIDPDRRTATVEPGVILDDLQDAAAEHGLIFGPDPSTHDRNTLGGMVGNNSCGVHSVMAGRTADNIESLDILTYDGLRMTVGSTGDGEFEAIEAEGGRRAGIYRGLRDLRDRYADEIRRRYPELPRRVSGYNLDELLPEKGFNVARALVGSEGTCVTVLRATCRLVDRPASRVLVVLGFDDVFAAADAVPRVMECGPIGLEGVDDKLIAFMRKKSLKTDKLELLPEGDGWLFAEFGGASRKEAEERAQALVAAMEKADPAPSAKLIADPERQADIWEVREAGLPATAHVLGMPETYPGWEDSAVPPERLGSYLRELRELFGAFDYEASLYGHFGDGCVHCRIDFDLGSRDGARRFHEFLGRASDLVVRHGGSLSGEHGDGQARGEMLDRMFGPDLVQAFERFKLIWDPERRMNPGKVVFADSATDYLRTGPKHRPQIHRSRLSFPEDENDFARVSARCVGVGKCRKHGTGAMCPSYIATGNEAYSTRGRARALFEMTRGDFLTDGWRSDAVHEALDYCLACKTCKSECPVNVDMGSYKAEFMSHYYQGRLRPRSAYSMGLIRNWLALGSRMPRLANLMSRGRLTAPLAKWAAGIAAGREVPHIASASFERGFRSEARHAPPSAGSRGPVILWADTFNNFLTPEPLRAAAVLLAAGGWQVELPPSGLCCGRPLYAFGFLDRARRRLRRILDAMRPAIRAGTPVVGVEPTCVATFREELPRMLPDDEDACRLAEQTRHLSEFLTDADWQPPDLGGRRVLVHPHCHHRAILSTDALKTLFAEANANVAIADAGCCGMAGDYGFRKESVAVSEKVAEDRFLPMIRDCPPDTVIVADGFSCREQARQLLGARLTTGPELLRSALR